MKETVSARIGRHPLDIETGHLAKQADAAVVVRYGETVVLAAVTTSAPREGIDFFPLTVDYREAMCAGGKFPGGFFKREGRPTGKEILTARSIDRPLRPLFPDGYRQEVAIYCSVLSADDQNDPDVLAMTAASAAMALSSIPFQGPVSSVRVGRVKEAFVINPTYPETNEGDLDLTLSGSDEKIVMIEVRAGEISEKDLMEAIRLGHEAIRKLNAVQRDLIARAGKTKQPFVPPLPDPALAARIEKEALKPMKAANLTPGKLARREAIQGVKDRILATHIHKQERGAEESDLAQQQKTIRGILDKLEERTLREEILASGTRPDGRKEQAIRPIQCEVGILPRPHGSALFTRGETQALVTTTLGTTEAEQKIEGFQEPHFKRFLLHYNFPAFCVGETFPNRGPKRREIGHGDLAERSLQPVMPEADVFPYTVRIVSDILESNGSSSMATVCGGTLALMHAGVPIRQPVAGISIGLVQEGNRYRLLTDIAGEEDHCGDMDFKVAGTQRGITGVQLDLKIDGLTYSVIEETLEQARTARAEILRIMLSAIPKPQSQVSTYAPKVCRLRIPQEKIGMVIGPGGRTIRDIEGETGANVEINDDGTVVLSARDQSNLQRAREWIEGLTAVAEIGRSYPGRVTGVKDFGAFVEFLPGQEGLVHISELSDNRVGDIYKAVKVGDTFQVKVIDVDDQGRVKLSRKALLVQNRQEA
jgi:polyribonucleotide nucleotidyltransferase